MSKNSLISKVKKKFKATTNSKHNLPVANNILNRKKQGFGVPIKYWLRNELKEMMFDELLSKSSNNLKYFKNCTLTTQTMGICFRDYYF